MQFKEIQTRDYLTKSNLPYTDYVINPWFENLNLRGDYKQRVLAYIHEKYPQLDNLYQRIYKEGDESYWLEMENAFTRYCDNRNIRYVNAFYHSKLVEGKVGKTK